MLAPPLERRAAPSTGSAAPGLNHLPRRHREHQAKEHDCFA
ncbi:hypothetical protein [Streptomyces sp. MNU77]|nr:hypothetical protein [Streptomyces sp. MNU77]